jgi:hypothetical protein
LPPTQSESPSQSKKSILKKSQSHAHPKKETLTVITDEIEDEINNRSIQKRNDTSLNTSFEADDLDVDIISERQPSIVAGTNKSIQKPISMSIKSSNNR